MSRTRQPRKTPKKRPSSRPWTKLPSQSTRWKAQADALLHAAQRAIHRVGPQVSMDEIAAEAGITKPILYRHFGDRRGLARALRDAAFNFVIPGEDGGPDARRAARERMSSLYPVVSDVDSLRRVAVNFGTGFQMFVEFNRNLYRFFRAEGVLDNTWEDRESGAPEPVAESLAASLVAIFGDRGATPTHAQIWAHGLRGIIKEIVDWWTEARSCDRFELERQIDLLVRAVLAGIERSLPVAPVKREARVSKRTATARKSTSPPRRGES